MGLDQYACAVLPHPKNTPTTIWWDTEEGTEEAETRGLDATTKIAYWRKHPDLQGWMENLYRSKTGLDLGWSDFNCVWVEVTMEDLAELEDAVSNDNLPFTEGFFFGESQPEDKDDDLAFIEAARQAIACDMQVYYRSWW